MSGRRVCIRAVDSRVSFIVLSGSTRSPAALDSLNVREVAACACCQDLHAQGAPGWFALG